MDAQGVSCFAIVPSVDIDDDDDYSAEVLGQFYDNPRQGWHWFGRNLRLRVRSCQGDGGADLISWLNNRSQSPLANYHLSRCPARAGCLKCEAAKKVTCEALNQALCLPCEEGLPLYCIGLNSPLLCPKWGRLEVGEYKARQDFFKQRGTDKPLAMSTRTVRLSSQVESPSSRPVSKLKKGFGRLVGKGTKDLEQAGRDDAGATLADDLGGLGLGTTSILAPKTVQPVSLEKELAARDESRRTQYRGRYLGTGVQGSGGDRWREQIPRTVGQDSLMASAEELSDWEEGYTVNLGGGRCPIDRRHCASTPNDPRSQDQRFDTQRGGSDLSAVAFGSEDLRGVAGVRSQQPHPGVESDAGSPSLRRGSRRVHFGTERDPGVADVPHTITGGHIDPLPAAASSGMVGRMNQSAPAAHGGSARGPGGVGGVEAGDLSGRGAFGGARPRDAPQVAQPHGPRRRSSPTPAELGSRANRSAPVGQAVGARGLGDVACSTGGGREGAEAYGGAPLVDPLQATRRRTDAQHLDVDQLGLGFSMPFIPGMGGGHQERDEQRDADSHNDDRQNRDCRDGDREHDRRDDRDDRDRRDDRDDRDRRRDRDDRDRRRDRNDRGRRGKPRHPGGGGDDGDGSGDNDEGESSGSDDSFLRRRRRRGMRQEDGDLSNALNLIVDRLENMSTSGGRGSAKQRAVTIPAVVRQPDGTISALGFYQWVMLLTRLVDDLKLDKSFVLLQLCTDPKIIPQSWRQTCLGCQSLGEAITRLSDINPPLDSTFPLLVAQLTGLDPSDGSHEQIIERAGELLASLSLLRALHPLKDLTREQSLACVFSLGSSLELQAGVMELIGEMDYLKRLPPGDAQHQDYTVSLINYLERQRKVRIDIVSSVECGRWSKPGSNPSLPSYAQPLVPARGRGGGADGRGAARGGQGGRSNAQSVPGNSQGAEKVRPPKRCGFSCGQSHSTWDCPKTLEVRLKKIPIPPSVCRKCCGSMEPGLPHKPECHIFQWNSKRDGKAYRVDRLCPVHKSNSCHALLCTSCGKDPQLPAPVPVVPSRANPLTPPQMDPVSGWPGNEGVAKIPSVIFMSEILTLEAADGSRLRVVAHYDSLSGCSFAHNVPSLFNHGPSGLISEVFNLSTFIGEGNYSLPVMTLRVASPGKNAKASTSVTCFVSEYPTIPPTNLPAGLKHLKFGNVSPTEQDGCSARVMIGAEYSGLFPVPVKTPRSIRRTYSGITVFKSQFSGQILLAGQLDRQHAKPGRCALPLFMTISEAPGCPPRKVGTKGVKGTRDRKVVPGRSSVDLPNGEGNPEPTLD